MARPLRENATIAYEPGDWPLKPVVAVFLGAVVLLVISAFVLIVAYPTTPADVRRELHINPPGPRLQTDEQGDLARYRADEQKHLETYYWIDKPKGLVHVPIEQAMKQLMQTGIPDFPKPVPTPQPKANP